MNEDEIRSLFARCVAALNYRALRLEVRERPLALLLVVESFGRGQEWGCLEPRAWRAILCENDDKSIWRLAEIHRLLKVFVAKGWLVVDAGAGTYRLRPDQWPCWAHVAISMARHDRDRLNFIPEPDLNTLLALLSQQQALSTADERGLTQMGTAKNSQTANFSQSRSDGQRVGIKPLYPPGPPLPPRPRPPDKPVVSELCGFSLRAGASVDLLGVLPVHIAALKEKHKGIKPLTDFESLRSMIDDIEERDPAKAYFAMCAILGGTVMEGGDLDGRGKVRLGDGGKWRNRWLTNRRKTHAVFAELVLQLKTGIVKSRGGKAEQLWKEFQRDAGPHREAKA